MQTEEIALSRIAENKDNPRSITTDKFQKLVKSLLVFPSMLTLRPIVVDNTMSVLGGNMRLRALKHIVGMDKDTLRLTIADENNKFTQGEVDALVGYWMCWRKKPVATIINADDLTERQKREFIIKDNVGFGDWDTDMLANQWDTDMLKDWGMEDWQLQGWASADDLKNGEQGDGSDKEPLPDDLTADDKNKPFAIRIVCTDKQQLTNLSIDLKELIDEKYKGADFSVSGGEL